METVNQENPQLPVRNLDLCLKQFEEFYDLLMKNAPEGYIPHFFPCEKNGKNPKKGYMWKDSNNNLSKEDCIKHIKMGYNIGLSALENDPLIIIDIDAEEFLEQAPKNTLTVASRKRAGSHSFCWDQDGSAKINLTTDNGEIRSRNEYVLACGSFVGFNFESKKDKEAYEKLPQYAKINKWLGHYTLKERETPKMINFDGLPQFFKEKEKDNDEKEAEVYQREEKKTYEDKEGKYTELFNLKVSDIIGKIPSGKRQGHPLHDSDTDSNFSLSNDGSVGHCWRHLVSLNAVQYLCVKAGYMNCEDCGTPHKGRGISKIRGDKKAYKKAYDEALKLKLIKKYEKNGKEEKEDYDETSKIIDVENKIIVEQVYDEKNGCRFCIYNHNDKSVTYAKKYTYNSVIYHPIVGEEIQKGAVLLPSEAIEYIDDPTLDKEIYAFANKWLDAPQETMRFGLWNVKVSHVYENFHTLNYLRVQGDTGTGKTRFLDVWGYLHYKPIFTTGTTTPAPLFRIIDKWRGTIVMDEADLRKSDESEQIIKILNNGFEKGKFIMRCDQTDASKLDFFDPFCPKILSTRRSFTDKATESRCITYISSVTERRDIPLNLNKDFFNTALGLRNKLLMWRFKNYFEIDNTIDFDLGDIEPRVKQIVGSYISLFSTDIEQMEDFKIYIQSYQEELTAERQNSFDGEIVGVIHKMINKDIKDFDCKDIVEEGNFTDRNGKPMNPRGITSTLKSLGFKKSIPIKIDGKTKRCVPIDKIHINKIFKRYGYEVTVVTVVTETSENVKKNINGNNNDNNDKNTNKGYGSGGLHSNRNDRNSVTADRKPISEINPLTEKSALSEGYTIQEVKDYLGGKQ